MSLQYLTPSSMRLELEAQRMHARPRPAGLAERAPAFVLAGFPQMLDLAVWTLVAALVAPRLFRPALGGPGAIAWGVTLVLLAFAARPAGSWLSRAVERRHGRGVRITASQFLMGAATMAVAFSPAPGSNLAAAMIVLAGCRLLQGVAMGGLPPSAAARAAGPAIPILSAALGLIVATGLYAALAGLLKPADFLDWGWRYPFAIAVPVNIVALFAQLRDLGAESPATDGKAGRLSLVSGN